MPFVLITMLGALSLIVIAVLRKGKTMGKKYIIEFEDKPFTNTELSFEDDETLWRVKGFRSLVFDQTGLDRLESFKEAVKEVKKECYDAGYARGLIQGKTDARAELGIIVENAEVNQLEVGDEIIWRDGSKSVVLDRDDVFFTELDVNGCISKHDINGGGYSKTGRYYDQIEKLLGALKK